jgi:phosphoglycolate phosphatase
MKMTTTRPALAFDLDGTLVDSLADLTTALNLSFASRMGDLIEDRPFETKVVRSMIGQGAWHLVAKAFTHAHQKTPEDTQIDEMLSAFRDAYSQVYL